MRRTEETGSGLLPTLRVSEAEGAPVKNAEMRNGSWSRLNKDGVRHGVKVKDVLAMLPTPRAGNPGSRPNGKGGKKTGLKLQPAFALWMMGYPTDWLDLKDGEMPLSKAQAMRLSRKSQK